MTPRYQELVDALYTRFSTPVTLLDAHFNIVAFSSQPAHLIDSSRADAILRRPPKPEVRAYLDTAMQSTDDRGRVSANEALGLLERVFVKVHAKGRLIGYLCIIDPERAVTYAALDDLSENLNAVGNELQLDRITRNGVREAVPSLLTGQPPEREIAAELIAARARVGYGAYRVVIIDAGANRAASSEATWAQLFHAEVAWGRIGSQCVVIVGGSSDHVLRRIRQGALDAAGERPIAAAGGVVDRLEDAHRSYREATLALQVLRSEALAARTVCWDSLGAWRPLLLLGREEALRCIDPRVNELIRTSTRTTIRLLQRYLERDSDTTTLALDFHLHRTTVYARLRRLQERYGLSWEDPEDRLVSIIGVRIALLYPVEQEPDKLLDTPSLPIRGVS
ncbi:PucR family transcriptional regulator [Paenarthrobacter aromaticivorans]|uniref:Helix-turn-helix domain-containing protein n=1 Tax=Paenarthrobacter aromaticivorans TaxID=2849150 RepID=A0ABS6IAZ9_9MICC|nr:helix-turn-helix domain-containing protein [Paenarthrobacter sp. MMS21-TAE1-1]MBU8868532.1 helix-turn-helix domain-containing protein [Paenarthrobacter sp. MMS21-TAE1-1]